MPRTHLGLALFLAAFAGLAVQGVGCASETGDPGNGGAGGTGGAGGGTGGAGGRRPRTTSSSGATVTTSATTSSGGAGGGVGTPCLSQADCKALVDACNTGNCVNNVCAQAPVNEGGPCDDGLYCTEADTCTLGVCSGVPMVCPSPDACHVGACDEPSKSCKVASGNDGASCAPSDTCFSAGQCAGGSCAGTTPVDCSFLSTVCLVGQCQAQLGCVAKATNEGGACDDGLFCTDGDACKAGSCTGVPKVCAPPANACAVATCDELAKSCDASPGNNGKACPPPTSCLTMTLCAAGTCGGGVAANEGGACNDLDPCSTGDVCHGGVCAGTGTISACVSGDGCCPPGCTFLNDSDCQPPLFSKPSYDAALTFTDASMSTAMTMGWDGTSYWSCSGGNTIGVRLAQYSPAGAVLGTYSPGIDFRSVFSLGGSGTTLFARGYSSLQILTQTQPGVFVATLTLSGGALDPQSSVVLSAAGEYVAMTGGTVTRWDATGAFLQSFPLNGFGVVNLLENQSPQNRGVVAAGGYYLTYYAGTLSAWDGTGTRLKTTSLNGAGQTVESYYSISYANGLVWVVDMSGGTWRGYPVDL